MKVTLETVISFCCWEK